MFFTIIQSTQKNPLRNLNLIPSCIQKRKKTILILEQSCYQKKMSDINIEAFFSDGEFAQKHIAGTVGFLCCRHLSKQVVATPVATKYFDSLDIHNNSNLFMFLNAIRYNYRYNMNFEQSTC
jgi:hypothetical protein